MQTACIAPLITNLVTALNENHYLASSSVHAFKNGNETPKPQNGNCGQNPEMTP